MQKLVPIRRARLDHLDRLEISFAVVNSKIVRLSHSLWHAACGMRTASSRRGARKGQSSRASLPPWETSLPSVPMEIQCSILEVHQVKPGLHGPAWREVAIVEALELFWQ